MPAAHTICKAERENKLLRVNSAFSPVFASLYDTIQLLRLPRMRALHKPSWAGQSNERRKYDFISRSLSDLEIRREGKRDRDQNLLKFEANSGFFNENLREFWPISAFP